MTTCTDGCLIAEARGAHLACDGPCAYSPSSEKVAHSGESKEAEIMIAHLRDGRADFGFLSREDAAEIIENLQRELALAKQVQDESDTLYDKLRDELVLAKRDAQRLATLTSDGPNLANFVRDAHNAMVDHMTMPWPAFYDKWREILYAAIDAARSQEGKS